MPEETATAADTFDDSLVGWAQRDVDRLEAMEAEGGVRARLAAQMLPKARNVLRGALDFAAASLSPCDE